MSNPDPHYLASNGISMAPDCQSSARGREEAFRLPDIGHAMRTRKDALYLRFDREGRLTTPSQAFQRDRAARYAYPAGFAAGEFGEYVSVDREWVDSIREKTEQFRADRLSV